MMCGLRLKEILCPQEADSSLLLDKRDPSALLKGQLLHVLGFSQAALGMATPRCLVKRAPMVPNAPYSNGHLLQMERIGLTSAWSMDGLMQ
jgi:hypothetical protein